MWALGPEIQCLLKVKEVIYQDAKKYVSNIPTSNLGYLVPTMIKIKIVSFSVDHNDIFDHIGVKHLM